MATKQHSTLTGSDLHITKIDGTTGTELTVASQNTYDGRYVKTAGGSTVIVPNAGNAVALTVNQNDTTNNPNALVVSNTGTGYTMFMTAPGSRFVYIGNQGGNTGVDTSDFQFYASHNDAVGVATVSQRSASATGTALFIQNLGAGTGLRVDNSNALSAGTETGIALTHGGTTGTGMTIARTGNAASAVTGLLVNTSNAGAGAAYAAAFQTGNVGIATTTPHSLLQVNGPIATAINTSAKTGAYTITATDSTIQADASGGTFQVTLPTAAAIPGRQYTIKRINATNNVTVGCAGAETIDGAATKTLGSQWAAVTVQSTGTAWLILNQVGTVT